MDGCAALIAIHDCTSTGADSRAGAMRSISANGITWQPAVSVGLQSVRLSNFAHPASAQSRLQMHFDLRKGLYVRPATEKCCSEGLCGSSLGKGLRPLAVRRGHITSACALQIGQGNVVAPSGTPSSP
jgi:hypothetical protein